MRWFVFFIAAFVLLALEVGLRPLWVLPVGPYGDAAPSLLLILGVFISLNTTAGVVVTAMILLGAATDVTQVVGKTESEPLRDIVLLGPAALGFLLGGYLTMQLRHVVFRDSVVTMVVMTFTIGLFMQLAIVLLIWLRSMLPTDAVPEWRVASQLMQRAMSVIYSSVVAIPLGLLLVRTRRMWLFNSTRGMMAN
jgi:hypothetical protein